MKIHVMTRDDRDGQDFAIEIDGSESADSMMARICEETGIPAEEFRCVIHAERAAPIEILVRRLDGSMVCQCNVFPKTAVRTLLAQVAEASGVPEWQIKLASGNDAIPSHQHLDPSGGQVIEDCVECPRDGAPLHMCLVRNLRPRDVTAGLEGPWGVDFARDGSSILIGCQGPGGGAAKFGREQACVSRLDLRTGRVDILQRHFIAPDGTVVSPAGVAISPCGTYALVGHFGDYGRNGAGGFVGRLDFESGELSWPYGGFNNPIDIAFSPCGKFALVSNSDQHNIGRIDMTSGEVTFPYSGGLSWPAGIAISPDGSMALVANSENHNIARIDLHSGRIDFPWAVDYPEGIAIAPSGEFAIAGSSYGAHLKYIDLHSEKMTTFARGRFGQPTRNWTEGIVKNVAISPDGSYVVVGNGKCDNIVCVEVKDAGV